MPNLDYLLTRPQLFLVLETLEGGSICLLCLSNLISNPRSPTVHVSYALSQLSQAISQAPFLHDLLIYHPHFLVSPLVDALSSFDDEPIARQVTDLVSQLSNIADDSVYGEFLDRIASRLSSSTLAWSCRQVYTLHCLGILLSHQKYDPYHHISDKEAFIFNLVAVFFILAENSEEIRGEIFFVLYKTSMLQYAKEDNDTIDPLFPYSPKLLHLSLEALMKTESDDVRLNCLALLIVLAQRGSFENACKHNMNSEVFCQDDNFKQTTDQVIDGPPLNFLFAEAIKGPLLSSDSEVQVRTLDLIFLYLSRDGSSGNEKALVEENIADYVFEILRLSGCKDPIVTSCLQVLDLLSKAEHAFRQRLAIGFATLFPVLYYVAGVPFHPVQAPTLKLIWKCFSHCPGIVSTSHLEEISFTVSGMLRKYTNGEIGMLPETFSMACSILVAIMKFPSSPGISNFTTAVQEASKHAILICTSNHGKYPILFMHSLYLLKEAYAYSCQKDSTGSIQMELRNCILSVCKTNLLPWFVKVVNEMEEDIVFGVLETCHLILLQDSYIHAVEFANILVTLSWFCFSFGCLGLFPTERMKWIVYQIFSSILDILLGNEFGKPIRDAALHLPSDPTDFLFLLGQKSSNNLELLSCQSAVLLVLYTSSLYDDWFADEKLVLASVEQYILVNSGEFLYEAVDSVPMELLINLYSLYRGLAKMSYQIPYSPEAERIMFHLINENKWDLSSARIHFKSMKWLFQQEKICKPLSCQILKLCQCFYLYGNPILMHESSGKNIDIRTIAELAASEDNFVATLLVYVLKELVEEDDQKPVIISVLGTIAMIINIFPAAADQLCLHGISTAIQSLFYHFGHSSPEMFMVVSRLTFGILHSVHSVSLSEDKAWLAITMKGPALIDHEEGTKTGEILLFVLVLHFFSVRSMPAVLPGMVDWLCFLDQANGLPPFSFISICCKDLCRLIHFGSSPIKLVASYCLLELLTRISKQQTEKSDQLTCSTKWLLSITAVLEGLVFCSDINVALNCSFSLSMILGWDKLDIELRAKQGKNWCRLIVEELAISLAVPSLASKSFMIHHKPAVHVVVALLKLQKDSDWLHSVFDDSCIGGIIKNLSASNVSSEIVLLFKELLNAGYLKDEHIASLSRVFQACRKFWYTNDSQGAKEEHMEKVMAIPEDTAIACQFLMKIISSQTCLDKDSRDCTLKAIDC
ncbi:unnamed protein product [Thlaspi arvense]|uniref:Protein PRD1 n=1 Tax=Thlaspi arvense TaxID=13288 RepID=A0AAU9RIM8_THLAR|nr:unnamed protein product [Thlaspi arvense]